MLDWNRIQCVFLDMDGTLLDLHFDNYFWQEHVPLRFAEQNQMELAQAKQALIPRFRAREGTMAWYCVDFWSRELGLDILGLKQEVQERIAVRDQVPAFLTGVQALGKRIVLVTNAHQKSLLLKLERTGIAVHFDRIICAHDLGLPKENTQFWTRLQKQEPFVAHTTLLIDDSLAVLRSAQQYGIAHLYAVLQPDSQAPHREIEEFPAVDNFLALLP